MNAHRLMTKRAGVSFLNILVALTAMASLAALVAPAAAQDNQLMTLGPSSSDRFAITDKTWPAEVGQAEICLWKDDALCAVSITIDDNNSPDHPWWIQTLDAYGWKATWFVITYLVEANPGFSGPWSNFQTLYDHGHDVQSHTVTHLNFDRGFDPNDPAHDIVHEYAYSITDIENHIPGNRVMVLAYPGGTNSSYNDDAVAAQYYIAARGTAGTINPVNKVNYIRTNSIGGLYVSRPDAAWAQLVNLFDPAAYRANNYRGWYSCHYHGMSDALKATTIEALDFLAAKDQEVGVWVGKFRHVAQYGQSRDSATLTPGPLASDSIRFTLTDQMHDSYYDFPLTVKVRVFDDWTSCKATQNGQPVDVETVQHEGAVYALVQAVPDRGQVVVSQAAAATPGDANGDGAVDISDFILLKQNYGVASGATVAQGDFNADGAVTIEDFIILKQNYGK